jgi:hypothetical protein
MSIEQASKIIRMISPRLKKPEHKMILIGIAMGAKSIEYLSQGCGFSHEKIQKIILQLIQKGFIELRDDLYDPFILKI